MGTLNAQQKHRAAAAEVVRGVRGAFLEEEAALSCVLMCPGIQEGARSGALGWLFVSGLHGPHDPAAQKLHVTEEQP